MASLNISTNTMDYEPKKKEAANGSVITHTLSPSVTLSSVVGLYYKDGVILGTDKQGSYGSMQYVKNLDKITKITNQILYASSGDLSDFQEMTRSLKFMEKKSRICDDGVTYKPKDYWNYIARLEYQQRNKFNPYLLSNVIAGYTDGQRFLGSVDHLGTSIENNYILTGFAGYFCKPLLTNYWNPECDEATALTILKECFKVLFCRDANATDRIQIAIVNSQGTRIEDDRIEVKWDYEGFKNISNDKINAEIQYK